MYTTIEMFMLSGTVFEVIEPFNLCLGEKIIDHKCFEKINK